MYEENKLIIREAKAEDVVEFQHDVCEAEREESRLCGSTPFKALLEGFVYSKECYTCLVGGKIIGMFGVCLTPQNEAVIWCLNSDDVERVSIQWIKEGKKYLNYFYKTYGVLTNIIHPNNTRNFNWLKRMGAIFSLPLSNGFNQFFIVEEIK